MGKLLRVDLTRGTVRNGPLPDETVLRKYLGGAGLGARILADELPGGVHPLDPQSLLIFMTGPLTGTPVPCANNTTAVFLNHETECTIGTSHSHGYFGPFLKFAGYDGIVIQGAANRPVYLWVHDGMAEIRDATKFWGKDTHETEDLVKQDVGSCEGVSVAAIGPAGENLVKGASVANDKHHLFAKGGIGGVMGSKKLKAIAVGGTLKQGVRISKPSELVATALEWRAALFNPDVWISYGTQGVGVAAIRYSPTAARLDWVRRHSERLMAVKNLSDPAFGREWARAIFRKAMDFRVTPVACFSCSRGCAYAIEITSGAYKGYVATLSGGGEGLEAASGMVGIMDAGATFWLADRYDRLGLDSGTAGCAISLAFECYEKGLLTTKDTDGLELEWGNADAAAQLLDKLARREGFGRLLAEGPKKAAELIGGDALKYAVHIKGAGMNLHDWRAAWSVLLGQIISGCGPCWQAPGADAFSPEPDLGYTELAKNPTSPEGKAEAVRKTQLKKLLEDSLGICWFGSWGVPGSLTYEARAIAATVGWEGFDVDEALTVGERVINLERLFNMSHGLTLETDLDVSQRLLEAPTTGPATGKEFGQYIKGMVREYYQEMGWDAETGRPLAKTLKRLGLKAC